ncbi:MAG TPA: UDP-N-acetylmuramoyl-tripeptide--D-alanyl-D-alanine ligase [Steroidobacteraceae bacterium]|nr:UDP-N-acetylmuramoyl-tripeptide--D-alanyl-D-alanine ligase [Steroidobacteraceae bacterium]
MITRDLQTLATVTGGVLHGANAGFGRVVSDSRAMEAGALFVALAGDRFDGHDFVADVGRCGAAGALVSRRVEAALPQVVVRDTLVALSRFAHAWRRSFRGPVVGITGSNGKTTVKEMAGAILAELGPCLVTQGNLNNHIGVPLTLCRLDDTHRCAVIEMGANHPGEIAHLAALARPDVGLVINAGPAHLEGFGGLDGVARGKGELLEALDTAGTAVINADDRFATFWHGLARRAGRVVTFGLRERADVSASHVRSRLGDAGFATSFELSTPEGKRTIELALAGEHNVMNALAATAAAMAAGASLDAVQRGLQSMRAVAGRLEVKHARGGARLIDDAYNANPGSLRVGLRALADVPGERWLVLGEMAELGDEGPRLHAEMGAFARECGVTRLLAVGAGAGPAVQAFGAGASWYPSTEELIAALEPDLHEGLTIYVKGSRVNRLERVTAALTGATATGSH